MAFLFNTEILITWPFEELGPRLHFRMRPFSHFIFIRQILGNLTKLGNTNESLRFS